MAYTVLCLLILLILQSKRLKKYASDINKISIAVKHLRYGDINIRVKDFNNKKLEISLNRLFETISDREGMIREYQATLSDKNMSLEEIIKQEKQLQQFKEEFIATLTHDMKVPVIAELNSIDYFLEKRFGSINDKQFEVLNLMKNSNLELKELIENMLEVYKLEQKELKLNIESHEFNSFLNSVINEMNPIASATNHKIVINLDKTNTLNVDFDYFQLKRVIKNLIQNAISFSPNASEVIIKTDKVKNNITISVANKGNNISKEDLNMIFNKYYTGSSKFRKAGTGLGLYISRQIVLAHNGSVSVENNEQGTTFIITLPLN